MATAKTVNTTSAGVPEKIRIGRNTASAIAPVIILVFICQVIGRPPDLRSLGLIKFSQKRSYSAESARTAVKFGNGIIDIGLGHIRPEFVGKIQFAVRRLPKQKI